MMVGNCWNTLISYERNIDNMTVYKGERLKKNWPIRKMSNECDLDDAIVKLLLVFERWDVFDVV